MKRKRSQIILTIFTSLLFSAATISIANAASDSSAVSKRWWSNQPLKSQPETHLDKKYLLGIYRAKAMPGGRKFFPLRAQKQRYLQLHNGRVVTRNDAFVWSIKKGEYAPFRMEGGDKRILHFAVDSHGNVVLTAIADQNRGYLITFNPPVIRVPAHLEPGKKIVTKSKISVVKLHNRKDVVVTGSATDTLEYLAQAKVKTPAGVFQCAYIKDRSVSNLSLAKVTTDSYRFLAPGVGVVAEYYHEHVRVFWIVSWNHFNTTLLEK